MRKRFFRHYRLIALDPAVHRYLAAAVCAFMVVRSALVPADSASVAFPAGFHAALTAIYILLAPTYDKPTCIEIVGVQAATLIGMALDMPSYWHYGYFPLVLTTIALLESYHVAQIIEDIWDGVL
jgi:hypothetical protein